MGAARGCRLVNEGDGGPALVDDELIHDRPPDGLGRRERRAGQNQQAPGPRARRQAEQSDDGGGEHIRDERRRQGEHECQRRPAPPQQQCGTPEDADTERQGVVRVGREVRVGGRHGDGEKIDDDRRDPPPQSPYGVHTVSPRSAPSCVSSRPARCAASAACTRPATPNFARIALTWSLTVPALR